MRYPVITAITAAALFAGQQAVAAPKGILTQATAERIGDTTVATWLSMDAKKIDAMYAPDVVGFDAGTGPLATTRVAFTKINEDFAAMKFDKGTVTARSVQILSPNTFVFSSYSDLTSTDGTMKTMSIRCTDVFKRQASGKFLIVNEHCSLPPTAG